MSSGLDPRTAVIVGAGQVVQRPGEGEELDPIALAAEAAHRAARDSGAGDALLRRLDSARHVATTGWPYRDEAALIASALGLSPRETVRTVPFGGDGPQRMLAQTAQEIVEGKVDAALITGAEALATLKARQRAGEMPSWQDDDGAPTRLVGDPTMPSSEAEMAVGLMAPIYNYALLETAVRRRRGAGPREHLEQIGSLWARFSEVAASNPSAWIQRALQRDELIDPSAENRPISAPYPKRLTANIAVDQASAVLICSVEVARAAGVPTDRWVFPWAGAHGHDEWFMTERDELAASPALAAAGEAAFEHSGLEAGEIAHVDIYSCFPSAVQIAAAALGLPIGERGRPLSVTGGLTFAGGPGNNYAGHAIATMVPRLRADPDASGLVTAVGWYMTKHALGLYSGRPPTRTFRDIDAGKLGERPAARSASAEYSGAATVEAYTVPYSQAGEPEALIISALAPDGTRALARSADREAIELALESDPLGADVAINGPGELAFGVFSS